VDIQCLSTFPTFLGSAAPLP